MGTSAYLVTELFNRHYVVSCIYNNVSEEHAASIFKADEGKVQTSSSETLIPHTAIHRVTSTKTNIQLTLIEIEPENWVTSCHIKFCGGTQTFFYC